MNKIVKLGEVCDLQNGFAFKSSDYVEKSNTLNIRMSNIRPDGSFNEMHKAKYLPDSYAEKYKEFSLKDGDLIIAMTDMAGDPKILGLPSLIKNLNGRTFLLNQRVGKLHKFSEKIYVPYLCYFLKTLKEYYKKKGAGGLQININKNEILSAPIILRPVAEQQRIVTKIDTASTEIDKIIINTTTTKNNLDLLMNKITNFKFNSCIEKKPLGELCDFLNGYAFKSTDSVDISNTQLLRMGNLYNNILDLERKSIFYPDSFAKTYKKYILNTGDIIMTLTGTVGKEDYGYAQKIRETPRKLLLNQRILKLHNFKNNIINKDFLLYYLHSKNFLDKLFKTSRGTRQANLSSDTIKMLQIPVPNMDNQIKILKSLKSLHDSKKIISNNLNKKMNNLKSLSLSLIRENLINKAA